MAAVAILAGLAYSHSNRDDPGLTTLIGLLVTPLLGGLAMSDPLLASGLAAAVAAVFAVKVPLHRFVRGTLTQAELNDAIIFAVVTLVIWPQLPDRFMGPLGAWNPHSLWLLIILVMVIGALGHIATRALAQAMACPSRALPQASFPARPPSEPWPTRRRKTYFR